MISSTFIVVSFDAAATKLCYLKFFIITIIFLSCLLFAVFD